MVTSGNPEFFALARIWGAILHCKGEARDDILGGFPMTAIAGQPHTLTIEAEHTTRAPMLSVQK